MQPKKSVSELLKLDGVAIVTGASMGIGQAITDRLHEAGAKVVIADINKDAAEAFAAELNARRPSSAVAVRADVSDANDVNGMVQTAVEQFGSVDILVNNAGIYPMQLFADMQEADFMKVIDVNLRGTFLCTKAATQQMKKQGRGGKVINITSVDALHPSMPGLAHYDASKHGMWGLTKNIAIELAKDKIWVNAIAPGAIKTPGTGVTEGHLPPGAEEVVAKAPMDRMAEPDEIAKVALFLASDMSSFMTGSQIVADGGLLLT